MNPANHHFIKVTEKSISPLTPEQKAALNRRGNQLFNEGHIDEAQRIFTTTGYSDGLTRIGDYYASQKKMLEALRLYCLAKNKRKSEPMIDSLVRLVRILIDTEKKGV
ncbi:MAG: hypothetical protein P1P60_00150 [Treponema phagedenis]|uniref:hypothetical protein n=1 Tax=Treponema phagedenis TaxID=162 RepID=UPI003133D0B2